MLARKAKQNTVEELELEFTLHRRVKAMKPEPDDHYPLTSTPEKWRLDAWEFEYLPFFAFAWKRSEELESYDVL